MAEYESLDFIMINRPITLKRNQVSSQLLYDLWGNANFRPKKIRKRFIRPRRVSFNYSYFLYKKVFQIYYNFSSKQLVTFARKFSNSKKFISTLESQLGIILIRLQWSSTSYESKFLISKGLFSVNGTIIRRFNYKLKPGDFITLNSFTALIFWRKRLLLHWFIGGLKPISNQSHLMIDFKSGGCLFLRAPKWVEINQAKVFNLKVMFFFLTKGSKGCF